MGPSVWDRPLASLCCADPRSPTPTTMPESPDTSAQTVANAAADSSHTGAGGDRRHWLMLVAGGILVLGLAISLAGAQLWRSSVRTHEKQAFQETATDVGETLE